MSDTKCKFRGFPNHPGVQSFTRTHRTSEGCYTHGCVYYGERIQVKSSQGKKNIVQNGAGDGFKNKTSIVPSLCLWSHDALLSWHQHVAISTEYCQPRKIRKAHPSFGASVFLGTPLCILDWLIDWLIVTWLTSVSRPTAPAIYHMADLTGMASPNPMSTG